MNESMNPPTVAVIHTSPATVELFNHLLAEQVPDARVMNVLDDSVLPQLHDNGGDIWDVAPRWLRYARNARDGGATVILNACSSIGELCDSAQRELGIPVVRVDQAMAAEAVKRAGSIAVVATLASTLRPTCDLLKATAWACEREIELVPLLVEGAYAALMAGDRERHDELVTQSLAQASVYAEVVVLAQASMARVLPRLSANDRARCLVSPPLAAASVARAVAQAVREAEPERAN